MAQLTTEIRGERLAVMWRLLRVVLQQQLRVGRPEEPHGATAGGDGWGQEMGVGAGRPLGRGQG